MTSPCLSFPTIKDDNLYQPGRVTVTIVRKSLSKGQLLLFVMDFGLRFPGTETRAGQHGVSLLLFTGRVVIGSLVAGRPILAGSLRAEDTALRGAAGTPVGRCGQMAPSLLVSGPPPCSPPGSRASFCDLCLSRGVCLSLFPPPPSFLFHTCALPVFLSNTFPLLPSNWPSPFPQGPTCTVQGLLF